MNGRKTNMPEFPPVTIYTLPVRSGRESGWKVIFKYSNSYKGSIDNEIYVGIGKEEKAIRNKLRFKLGI